MRPASSAENSAESVGCSLLTDAEVVPCDSRERSFDPYSACGMQPSRRCCSLARINQRYRTGFEYGLVNNAILPRRIQPQVLSQEMISGHTSACAWRPTRIPRCCKETPTSPGYSMIRTFSTSIASVNGLIEAEGATSSAVFTTASVGIDRLKGLTSVLPSFKAPRQKRLSR